MWSYRNVMPGFGSPPDGDPPPDLDYDLWLGPAPKRPYNPNRSLYHFRWFWDYSGGQMTNLGQHSLDIVHWFLDATAPTAVTSAGGRFALRDNGETPDTQDALFEYGGWTATWSHREASRGAPPAVGPGVLRHAGSLTISRKGFIVTPDPELAPGAASLVRRRASGRRPGELPAIESPAERTGAVEDRSGDDTTSSDATPATSSTRPLARDPVSDLESGHRVATACHLANLSLRLGRKLRWDADRETIAGRSRSRRRCSNGRTAPPGTPSEKALLGRDDR